MKGWLESGGCGHCTPKHSRGVLGMEETETYVYGSLGRGAKAQSSTTSRSRRQDRSARRRYASRSTPRRRTRWLSSRETHPCASAHARLGGADDEAAEVPLTISSRFHPESHRTFRPPGRIVRSIARRPRPSPKRPWPIRRTTGTAGRFASSPQSTERKASS